MVLTNTHSRTRRPRRLCARPLDAADGRSPHLPFQRFPSSGPHRTARGPLSLSREKSEADIKSVCPAIKMSQKSTRTKSDSQGQPWLGLQAVVMMAGGGLLRRTPSHLVQRSPTLVAPGTGAPVRLSRLRMRSRGGGAGAGAAADTGEPRSLARRSPPAGQGDLRVLWAPSGDTPQGGGHS